MLTFDIPNFIPLTIVFFFQKVDFALRLYYNKLCYCSEIYYLGYAVRGSCTTEDCEPCQAGNRAALSNTTV